MIHASDTRTPYGQQLPTCFGCCLNGFGMLHMQAKGHWTEDLLSSVWGRLWHLVWQLPGHQDGREPERGVLHGAQQLHSLGPMQPC
jgi:hypothetical protein